MGKDEREEQGQNGGESAIFVARQPIFRLNRRVFGYELLFRSGLANFFDPDQDGSAATSKVITNSFLLIGIRKITGGKKAFINFNDEFLLKEYPLLVPKKLVVVEVLEDTVLTPALLRACQNLVARGYTLALDDFVYQPSLEPLIELAHIVKLDVRAKTLDELEEDVDRLAPHRLALLAEKVETQQEFESLKQLGFKLFQGYFFSKPLIVQGRDIPGSKLQYLRILKLINDENYDFAKVAELISKDLSLSYKLLKYVNSAASRGRMEVTTLQGAVARAGEMNLRKWLSLIMCSYLAEDKPAEILRLTIMRANFAGQVGAALDRGHEFANICHTLGMFSLLDVLLDQPMSVVVAGLNFNREISATLTGEKKTRFSEILVLTMAYEKGDWQTVTDLALRMGDILNRLPFFYEDAMEAVKLFYEIT